MKYELDKKLKDAGFPQSKEGKRYFVYNFRDLKPDVIKLQTFEEHCNDPQEDAVIDDVSIPTLSELIQACGDGFETLSRDTSTETLVWICNNYIDPNEEFDGEVFYEGSTPEEAVANLWLELNKKQ